MTRINTAELLSCRLLRLGPHPLEAALVPLDDLEVVPDELAPGVGAGVRQQSHADNRLKKKI